MTDSRWSDMLQSLNRNSSRKKTYKAADFVPGDTSQLRSLDHLPLHNRTPQTNFSRLNVSRLHYSEHMPRYQEEKARRWIQRPHHEYEIMPEWTDHGNTHHQFSNCTGTSLAHDARHLPRRTSLTPSDGSGGYGLPRRHSHRTGSQDSHLQNERLRVHHRRRPQSRDRRDDDVRYQDMMAGPRQSRGYFNVEFTGERRASHSGHRRGEQRHQVHERDRW